MQAGRAAGHREPAGPPHLHRGGPTRPLLDRPRLLPLRRPRGRGPRRPRASRAGAADRADRRQLRRDRRRRLRAPHLPPRQPAPRPLPTAADLARAGELLGRLLLPRPRLGLVRRGRLLPRLRRVSGGARRGLTRGLDADEDRHLAVLEMLPGGRVVDPVELLEDGREAGVDHRPQQVVALEPEAARVAERAPRPGYLTEPATAAPFVLAQLVVEQFAEGLQLPPLDRGEVGRHDQEPAGRPSQLVEEGDRLIEVVQEPGAEDRVETAVGLEVADVVLDEAEIVEADLLGDPAADLEVVGLPLDPDHLIPR